jgi:hypothetical protein
MTRLFEHPSELLRYLWELLAAALNNLLGLASLQCALTSDSNAAFNGVPVKIALTLDLLLRFCLYAPPLGKGLVSNGLI